MKHLLIKNGTIVDGTGAPPYKGDLVLVEEKITEVGHHLDLPKQIPGIDVSGSIVLHRLAEETARMIYKSGEMY